MDPPTARHQHPNAATGLSEAAGGTVKGPRDGSVRARTVPDREPGSSRGSGFVHFDSEEDAKPTDKATEDGESDGNAVPLD